MSALATGGLRERLRRLVPAGSLDLATVLGGTFTRNALRGVFKIVVAGFLAPQALGVLRSIYGLFKILTRLTDLGLDYATVTFVSATFRDSRADERDRLLGSVLLLKVQITAFVILAGNLAAPALARFALSDESLTFYVRLVMFAVGGQLFWGYVSSYLTALQRFRPLALFLITVPALMLLAALGLIVAGRFGLPAGIVIYLFAPGVTALLWWPLIGRRFLKRGLWCPAAVRRILGFSRWIYITSLASANRNHLNPLLLKSPALSGSVAAGEYNAGLYSFGNDLANEVTLFSTSLVKFLLPKASRKTTRRQLRGFVGRSYRYLAIVVVPAVLAPLLARPLLLLLGSIKQNYLEYLPSLTVFAILYVGALCSIASIPMQTALYALNLPRVETYLEIALVFVLVAGGVLLIPRYGPEGAALVVLAQRVLSLITLVAYGWVQLRRPD